MKGPAHTVAQSAKVSDSIHAVIRPMTYGKEVRKARHTDADDDEVRFQRYPSARVYPEVDTKNDGTTNCSFTRNGQFGDEM